MKTATLTLEDIYKITFNTLNQVVSKTYPNFEQNYFLQTWLEEPLKKISKRYETIDKTRQGIIRKYGEKKESGEYDIEVGTKEYEKFEKEFEKILDKKIDIDFENSSFRSFEQLKEQNFNFSPIELMSLKHFIESDEKNISHNSIPEKETVDANK